MNPPTLRTQALALALAALVPSPGCSGGTAAVLEQELEQDQARRARRAAVEQAIAHDRAAARARAPAALADHLGVPVAQVASWELHVTPGAALVGARDPAARVCAVLMVTEEAVRVDSVGRPPALPTPEALSTARRRAGGAYTLSDLDELRDLEAWLDARCAP